jgi:hypothetical protein
LIRRHFPLFFFFSIFKTLDASNVRFFRDALPFPRLPADESRRSPVERNASISL